LALTLRPYALECKTAVPGTAYNNDDFADGNGPRGAMNASECCDICATTAGCRYWSYNIDPGECVGGSVAAAVCMRMRMVPGRLLCPLSRGSVC